jgi:hypothetical protein
MAQTGLLLLEDILQRPDYAVCWHVNGSLALQHTTAYVGTPYIPLCQNPLTLLL